MSIFKARAVRAVRLGFIPAVCLAFMPYAIAAGRDPGFVRPDHVGPYPLGHVAAVIALLAIESAFLFVMLSPTSYRLADWRRGLKALGLVFLALALEPMVTDRPGYVYVNTGFLFTWFVILAVLVLSGIVASRASAARVRDS